MGKVLCRGMLVENKVYRRGDYLSQEHYEMVVGLFRKSLSHIETSGWLSITGGHINVVLFSTEPPVFLQ